MVGEGFNSKDTTMKQERAKSDYVKTFSTEGLPKENIICIDKPRKNEQFTPYHLKKYLKCDNPKQYLATIEAVSSSLMKLVFGADFTPKVRVVAGGGNSSSPQAISKTLVNLRHFRTLTEANIAEIRNKKQRDLAKLLLTVFCFKEPDLHAGNWGIDGDTLVHFDNDRKFAPFSIQFAGAEAPAGAETDCAMLALWSNLIYSLEDAFSIVSPDDLLDMVLFKDLKPYNHPFKRTSSHLDTTLSGFLSSDPLFIQWKFFYLTKYLLLMTKDRVKTIIESHSIAPDAMDDSFCAEIMTHHAKIKTALFYLPEYQAFLKNFSIELFNEMLSELSDYNKELCDKKGQIKLPKKKFAVLLDTTLASDFAALQREARDTINNDTPEKAARRHIDLQLARIKRGIAAIQNIHYALHIERKRCQKIQHNDINCFNKSPKNLLTSEKDICKQFFNDHSIDFMDYRAYLHKNSNDTIKQFLLYVIKKSEEEHQPILINDHKNHKVEVDRYLQNLFTSYGKQLTQEDLQTLWSVLNNEDINFTTTTAIYMLEYCTFEKIPVDLIDWMSKHGDDIANVPFIKSKQYPMFSQLFYLVSALQIPVAPTINSSRFFTPIYQVPKISVIDKLKELLTQPAHRLSLSNKELIDFIATFPVHLSQLMNLTALRITADIERTHPSTNQFLVALTFENNQFILQAQAQPLFLTPSIRPKPLVPRRIVSSAEFRPSRFR